MLIQVLLQMDRHVGRDFPGSQNLDQGEIPLDHQAHLSVRKRVSFLEAVGLQGKEQGC